MERKNRLTAISVGKSVQGRTLSAWRAGEGDSFLYICGGMHGDEPESVELVSTLLEQWSTRKIPGSMVLIPVLNPDGLLALCRTNANGVDLNRNFPTQNWGKEGVNPSVEGDASRYFPGQSPASEPETLALLTLFQRYPPSVIVSVHSWKPQVNFDGPAKEFAERIAKHNGYPVTASIGYPTHGSLGEYAGVERAIPTVTLELPEGIPKEEAWTLHQQAFEDLLGSTSASPK